MSGHHQVTLLTRRADPGRHRDAYSSRLLLPTFYRLLRQFVALYYQGWDPYITLMSMRCGLLQKRGALCKVRALPAQPQKGKQ